MKYYRNIVILTGAGISAESGLSTFRDQGGLWEKHKIEDVATPEAFMRDPDTVYQFYNLRRQQLKSARPNPAHLALARLEREHTGSVIIVTQNVDNLHEAAGSRHIIHMHGELSKVRCRACGSILDWSEDCDGTTKCTCCKAPGNLRPHIVWFGEMPLYMDEIYEHLLGADLFVSIGTSGNVYPAAGFVAEVVSHNHAHTLEINMEPSAGASLFAECRHGPAGELVPAFVENVLKTGG